MQNWVTALQFSAFQSNRSIMSWPPRPKWNAASIPPGVYDYKATARISDFSFFYFPLDPR